jgi:hypothetical protein
LVAALEILAFQLSVEFTPCCSLGLFSLIPPAIVFGVAMFFTVSPCSYVFAGFPNFLYKKK